MFPGGLGLPTAEVTDSPGGVAQGRDPSGVCVSQKRFDDVEGQTEVTAVWRVSGDISECPDCLFTNIVGGRVQKKREGRKGSLVDNVLCLVGGATCDVGQTPSCFELKLRIRVFSKAGNENWNQTRVDNFLDWRIVFN